MRQFSFGAYVTSLTLHTLPGVLTCRTLTLNVLVFPQWSDVLVVSTLAVAPGPCPAPKLQGKPRANFLHLRWGEWL